MALSATCTCAVMDRVAKQKKKKEERGTKGGSVVGLEWRIILAALCKCVEKSGVETSETCLPILAKRSAPYVWS